MGVPAKNQAPLIVPASVRRRAGIEPNEKLEFKTTRGVITVTAKRASSQDEYTPEQRRKILRGIRQGLADIEAGRFYAYNSAAEMAADIEAEVRKRNARKLTSRK